MYEFDWNMIANLISTTTSILTLTVATLALIYTKKQLDESERQRLITIALTINSNIQNYRNNPDIRNLRYHLRTLLINHRNEMVRLNKLLEDGQKDKIYEFMARMNNLCWEINALSSQSNPSVKASILKTIDKNLVAEWHCLLPLIRYERRVRKRDRLDDGNWYMKDFEVVVIYAQENS